MLEAYLQETIPTQPRGGILGCGMTVVEIHVVVLSQVIGSRSDVLGSPPAAHRKLDCSSAKLIPLQLLNVVRAVLLLLLGSANLDIGFA